MRDQWIKTSHVAILVYSITNRNSFNSIPGLYERVLRVKDEEYFPAIIVG